MLQKLPFIISLSGIALGVIIAVLFGVNEEIFKNKINDGLSQNKKIQAIADESAKSAKIAGEASKNWRYYQRFHFHSTGIGAMSIGVLLLLLFVAAPTKQKDVASWLTSVGGFLYPFLWFFAAVYGPEMGRTEAKEAFAFFGYMGGLFLLGVILTIYLLARYPFKKA